VRIVVTTIGSRGDLEPALALAIGLRARGHSVTITGAPELRSFVDTWRLDYRELQTHRAGSVGPDRGTLWSLIGGIAPGRRHVIRQFDTLVDLCRDADLVVSSLTFSVVALSIRERFGIPFCLYSLSPPPIATGTRPVPWFSPPVLGPRWNRFTYRLFESVLWLPQRRSVNAWRRRRLSLPPLPTRLFDTIHATGSPWLLAMSRTLYDRCPDWPENVQVTGRWFLDTGRGYSPPERLAAFLENGPPPICVTFGSNPISDRHGVLGALAEALDGTGQRAVLVGGTSRLGQGICMGERVLSISNVPFDWLFPRIRLAIHHGGAGTTAHSLRAGVPSVVIPTRVDQVAFARRLHELGVAPKPIELRRLDGDRLAKAVREALDDDMVLRRADLLARDVERERGVAEALRVIERHARGSVDGTSVAAAAEP
jgi:sterol 3beta-glucosyltransferase